MKLVDKKCRNCGKVYRDLIDTDSDADSDKDSAKDSDKCECGELLYRIFSFRPDIFFKPGFYENFEYDPIYIENKKQFKQECDKRGLVRVF